LLDEVSSLSSLSEITKAPKNIAKKKQDNITKWFIDNPNQYKNPIIKHERINKIYVEYLQEKERNRP